MRDFFHQARLVYGKLSLVLPLLLIACVPTSPLPNQITSTDSIGEIVVRYPRDWNNYAEVSSIAGRQGVTLVRAERSMIETTSDLTTLPVLRLTYDRRADTPLNENQPLVEYALRLASEQFSNVTFEPPQLRQISSRAAVSLEGIDSSISLAIRYTLVDYVPEDGVLTAVLIAPANISSYAGAHDLMLENTRLTLRSASSAVTLLPESTADLPVSTSDVTPDSTSMSVTPMPESSAEAQPTLSESEATAVMTAEGTPEVNAERVTLGRGVQLQKPIGWIVSTNRQTNVTLSDGQRTAEALLAAQPLPAGEALISIEVGTLEEVFRQPLSGFNLERWFTNELGRLVTQGGAAAQSSEIEAVAGDDEESGLGALVTTPQYDRYVIVDSLGGSLYQRVQLYTAPGEFADYQSVLLQVAASIELAPR